MKKMKRILAAMLIVLLAAQIMVPVFAEESETSNAFQVLFSGIDNRGPLIPESNTDANIIITVNTDTKQILLVHIPRDYYVEAEDGTKDKLTNHGLKGIDSVLWAVNNFFEAEIQYYLRFNFQGFIDFIDAMGGIDVESEYTFSVGDYHYVKGMNHLNGSQALAFARERKSFKIGDRQRGRDQMLLMKAGIKAFTSGNALNNYAAILEMTRGCLETNVSYSYITRMLGAQLDSKAEWNVVMTSVDGTDSSSGSAYVMEPDMETVKKAQDLMQRVLDGEILDQEKDAPYHQDAGALDFADKEYIKRVQTALNEAGYDCGEPDSIVGSRTKDAIRAYQEASGLDVTGIIGRELVKSLGVDN